MNLITEFNNQVATLINKGYPKLVDLSESEFTHLLEPLRAKVATLDVPTVDFEKGYLPFVLVVSSELLPTDTAMSLVEKEGKAGVTKLFPHEPSDFTPITDVTIPSSQVYLLLDIDRGRESINLPPSEAMKILVAAGRSPLTIDEGVSIVTQYPEFLIKNNCFSLLASRHTGDQRVPAIWINGAKHPNLGWCWNGNPHTWLGSASCGERIGLDALDLLIGNSQMNTGL